MGLTPLEGVVMGTRSGSIDPAIVEYIAKKENLDLAGVMNVLNKKSGLQGMSGVSSDMRDLRAAAAEGNDCLLYTSCLKIISVKCDTYYAESLF